MKQVLNVITGLLITVVGFSQPYIHGTVRQGSSANKVDILFKPDAGYDNNGSGAEYIVYMQFAIAIPASGNTSLIASFAPAAPFNTVAFTPQPVYEFNGERIYNWTWSNVGTVTSMTWTGGTPFPLGTVTFTGGGAPSKVRLVDLSNQGGNGNTFFVITLNTANYPVEVGTFFYADSNPSNGSTLGSYVAGDRYVETNELISLPVSMLNFSGYKNASKNTLNWTVASEVNNRGFDVQRSTDGVNYSSIGFVNSQAPGGFTNSEVHYTFDDNSPIGKKQYYRLNQKDIDGNTKLSSVVTITGDKATILGIAGIFPNPASTQVNVIIDAPKRDRVTLVITDMAGKTVKQQKENVETGSNTIPVDIAKLAVGSYVIKLICQLSECETAVGKFNKQ